MRIDQRPITTIPIVARALRLYGPGATLAQAIRLRRSK